MWQLLDGLDGGPAHQPGGLLGDVSAHHGGVDSWPGGLMIGVNLSTP
jgi:hypothetical protein